MRKAEFLKELEASLKGEIPAGAVSDNLRYYDNYISQEVAKGRSESEVIEEIGSPRLIAKTIIDTSGEASTQGNSRAGSYNYSTGSDDSSTGGDGWSFSWMKETASKNWVTKTIAILAIVAVVFLVLSIIFKLVAILFKPAVVVLAVAAVYYLVKNSSNK